MVYAQFSKLTRNSWQAKKRLYSTWLTTIFLACAMLQAPVYCNTIFTETVCKSQEQSLEIKANLAFSDSVKNPSPYAIIQLRQQRSPANASNSRMSSRFPTGRLNISCKESFNDSNMLLLIAYAIWEISGKQISAIEPNLYAQHRSMHSQKFHACTWFFDVARMIDK